MPIRSDLSFYEKSVIKLTVSALVCRRQLHNLNVLPHWENWRRAGPVFGLSLLLSLPLSVLAQRLQPTFPETFSPWFTPVPHQNVTHVPVRRTVTRPALTKAQLNQALIAEAYHGSASRVAGLLQQGADPNAKGMTGTPVLCYAVAAKSSAAQSSAVAALLLSKGAHINAVDRRGNTALAEAVGLKAEALVKLLLERGANADVRNGSGFTALGIATVNNDAAALRLLIASKADVQAPQQRGMTPLALAAGLEHPEAVRVLVQAYLCMSRRRLWQSLVMRRMEKSSAFLRSASAQGRAAD